MDGLHINSGSVLINTKRNGQRKQNQSGSFECSKQSILSSMDKFVRTVQSMRGTILVPSKLRDMRLRPRLPDCEITLLANSASTAGNNNIKTNQLKNKPLNSTNSTTKHNLHSHFHSHSHYHLLRNHHLQDYHLGYHIHSTSVNNSTIENAKLNYDPAEIPSALMNADLYNFYSMLYDVKQQLLWGPASGQSTIFTNYNTNSDLNQSNSRFLIDKSSFNQLNSTMANCNLNNSDNNSTISNQVASNLLKMKDNRAESTCSSGYSSNSSTRNSTTNLSFIAQCNSPTMANSSCTSSSNSLSPISTRPPSSATSSDDNSTNDSNSNNQSDVHDDVKLNESTSSSSTNSDKIDSPQSKTPQSDSDLESELESDSILTDRTSEPITDQTQLLASAFRHHLQALHTILDQLTHSAEYLSRNYELDLGEGNSHN